MDCIGSVVHAESFISKKNEVYTKLFVPVGFEIIPVFCNGDLTYLIGKNNVHFRLGVKDNHLRLFFVGEEG